MLLDLNPGYIPHLHQRRFHRSHARFLCAAAGVRGGKTKSGAAEFVRRIARDLQAGKGNKVVGIGRKRRPRLHYWIVAPVSDLLKEPTRYLFESLPPDWIELYLAHANELWLKGDILIEFKTADRPLNLVSVGLNGMWIDEAARLKPDAWRGQLRPRLSDHEGWALFSTTPLGKNWLYDDVVTKSGTDQFETIAWTTADNPIIARAEIASAKRTLPLRYYMREYEASFEAFIGTVFDEWDERIHVTSEAALRLEFGLGSRPLRSLFRRVIAGIDWGWNSPGAIVVIGDYGTGWVILEESYAANRIVFDPRLPSGTWVSEGKRLREKWGISQFFGDPANPSAIFDFQRAGLPIVGADNEVIFGVRKLSEALHPVEGKPRLRVLDGCKNLRREIPLYQWAESKSGERFSDLPADGQSDHGIDAGRYGIVELLRYESAGTERRHSNAGPVM